MKFHLILLLKDDSLLTLDYEVTSSTSIAKLLTEAAKNDTVAKALPNIVKAIRIVDKEVFVDNRERILWLMGCSPVVPADPLEDHAA